MPSSEDEPLTRGYSIDINRCAELEKKLEYFEYEMLKENVFIAQPDIDPKPIHPAEMIMFESMIEKWENDMLENSRNLLDLQEDINEMKEMSAIMRHIGPMLDKSKEDMHDILTKFNEVGEHPLYHGNLYIMTGVIERDKSLQCQKMLWRISLGNIHYRQADHNLVTENPHTGRETQKVAFLAVCQGEALRTRTEKICAAFKAKIHPCPRCKGDREALLDKVDSRIIELESILYRSKYYRCMALRSIGKQWRVWLIQVRKTKAIYQNMNLMKLDLPKNCLIGRCWIAERDIDKVQKTMDSCTEDMGVRAPSVVTEIKNSDVLPPTLQKTNTFTYAPQALINAYGDARYKEINPGLFTIIGLPFLFCVMFGDMGHAIIITVAALWMIVREAKLKERRGNEVWEIFFAGRYMLLLMGLWSLYSGFVFNQVFTKSMNLSSTNSMYKNTFPENALLSSNGKMKLGAHSRRSKQYIFGADPMWQMANNRVELKSSQMMKLSVIIGTLHMLFGIILSAFNHCYFKNSYAICLQFLPQFLFLLCLFGWTVVLIYWKWWFYYDGHSDVNKSAECAPKLLPHFLSRFIPVEMSLPSKCKTVMFFEDQLMMQNILNLIVIISILVLLFGTPVYIHMFNLRTKSNLQREMRNYRMRHMRGCKLSCLNPCGDLCGEGCRKQEEKWQAIIIRHSTPFSSLMTNQFIHTIEFVLGTVSHLASYLRLWALGMGHYLIADALWVMVLRWMGIRKFERKGFLFIALAFAVFAIFTFIVLVVMEGIACFLHALRLHWVEFMSKFYVDEGHPFTPFSFKNINSDTYTKSTDKKYEMCKRSLRPKQKFHKCLDTYIV